ncbi:hypothetical protein FRC12_004319 [Ceratobasidium sp. 428]|nr:hypothetical protein FRC09_000826 [Ceratobasidium sp. 395]KAG8796122.1 hypothetical protein FRC12_004319 [Ceratobasidium sp. 428]
MPSASTRPQRPYRSSLPNYTFHCPSCGHGIAHNRIERHCAIIRGVNRRRIGRYVNVRQLRLFIEIARAELDWTNAWVSMELLQAIIAHIAQMRDEDDMDIDTQPSPIQDVIHRLAELGLTCN